MDVWPLRPNWRDPLRITYSFSTEIISSRNGREQRRARRQSPRKTVEFSATVDRDRFRALTRAFAKLQGPLIAWADQTRAVRTVAPSVSPTVTVSAAPEWAVTGRQAILQWDDTHELRTVQGVNGATVTFTAAISAWAARSRLCPAIIGRLAPEITSQHYLPGVIDAPVHIDVDPGSEPARVPPAPNNTWNGREVFLDLRGNWRDPRDLTFAQELQAVDYGRGRIAVYTPYVAPWTVHSIDYMFRSKAEADLLLRFFERHKGQRGEFYVPSDQPDILIQQTAFANTGAIVATGSGLLAYNADPMFKAIAVKMSDGRRFYRSVASIVADGAHSRINLVGTIPYQLDPGTVEVISWLPVMRHATDDATFEWLTDESGQVRFTFRTLPDAPPE